MGTEETKKINFWPFVIIFILLFLILRANRYIEMEIEEISQPTNPTPSVVSPMANKKAAPSLKSEQHSADSAMKQKIDDDFPEPVKINKPVVRERDTRVIREMPLADVILPQ